MGKFSIIVIAFSVAAKDELACAFYFCLALQKERRILRARRAVYAKGAFCNNGADGGFGKNGGFSMTKGDFFGGKIAAVRKQLRFCVFFWIAPKQSVRAFFKAVLFDFLRRKGGETPLLLLDDIFDKLDSNRVEQIVGLVSGDGFGQIFITDVNREHIDNILEHVTGEYRLFGVENGNVALLKERNG